MCSKRHLKGPQNAEHDVEMWRLWWWRHRCIFLRSSANVFPSWIISREVGELWRKPESRNSFFFFFLSESRGGDFWPPSPQRKLTGPILSPLNTIVLRNDWHSSAGGALKCRATRRQAGTFFFCRVCHAPQVAAVCFFCRQINKSWIFDDCLLWLR